MLHDHEMLQQKARFTSAESPMPAGRPSEYRQSYCNEVLSLMSEGLSLTAAMAELGFTRQRAHDWADKHPEFRDAIALGQGKRTLRLERDMMAAASGAIVTARALALKNSAPDEWREKQEVAHTVEVVTKEQRDAAVAAATRADR